MIDLQRCYMELSKEHPNARHFGNETFRHDVPVLIWVKDIKDLDAGAIEQLMNAAKLPFVFNHIAAMADTHQGYGITIGGVVPCIDVVVPYFVGKDKGCGMRYVQTDFKVKDLSEEMIVRIRRAVRKAVPVGAGKVHQKIQEWDGFDRYLDKTHYSPGAWYTPERWTWFKRSLGTLGSGNHFLEVQATDKDNVGLMLHSGSRNLGSTLCDFHHNIAKDMCTKYHAKIPNEHCSFLPANSDEGQQYITDMTFALEYAEESRKRMMTAFKEAFVEEIAQATVTFEEDLDVHHNYVTLENHFGKNVWLHRKGAISAKEGELGIIPGSQGSNSYIIRGKGNRDSFMSCPHGAGRRFGRNEACKRLDIKEETEKMKGVVFDSYGSVTLKGKEYPNLQEAEGAYKDINEVMENSEDLCEIVTKLRPLGSIKGHDRRSKNG